MADNWGVAGEVEMCVRFGFGSVRIVSSRFVVEGHLEAVAGGTHVEFQIIGWEHGGACWEEGLGCLNHEVRGLSVCNRH